MATLKFDYICLNFSDKRFKVWDVVTSRGLISKLQPSEYPLLTPKPQWLHKRLAVEPGLGLFLHRYYGNT